MQVIKRLRILLFHTVTTSLRFRLINNPNDTFEGMSEEKNTHINPHTCNYREGKREKTRNTIFPLPASLSIAIRERKGFSQFEFLTMKLDIRDEFTTRCLRFEFHVVKKQHTHATIKYIFITNQKKNLICLWMNISICSLYPTQMNNLIDLNKMNEFLSVQPRQGPSFVNLLVKLYEGAS